MTDSGTNRYAGRCCGCGTNVEARAGHFNGGAGASDNWIATGRTCYKCNGSGTLVKS